MKSHIKIIVPQVERRAQFASWETFNAHLLTQRQRRRERKLRGHEQSIATSSLGK